MQIMFFYDHDYELVCFCRLVFVNVLQQSSQIYASVSCAVLLLFGGKLCDISDLVYQTAMDELLKNKLGEWNQLNQ